MVPTHCNYSQQVTVYSPLKKKKKKIERKNEIVFYVRAMYYIFDVTTRSLVNTNLLLLYVTCSFTCGTYSRSFAYNFFLFVDVRKIYTILLKLKVPFHCSVTEENLNILWFYYFYRKVKYIINHYTIA